MPASLVLFIGHGNPMNTLEVNRYTKAWRDLGRRLPRPRAVLMVSAHWYFAATAVTAMARPRTIHDFYGFPQALFDFDYPRRARPNWPRRSPRWPSRTGSASIATSGDLTTVPECAGAHVSGCRRAGRAVVDQCAETRGIPPRTRRAAGSLRERGVMIVGSGNVVHNLKRVQWDRPQAAFDWAERFDEAAVAQMASDPAAILKLAGHADYALAVPTPDHFLPLVYVAGVVAAGEGRAAAFARGHALGSISMTCYAAGCEPVEDADGAAAAALPVGVPPEQTNL